MNFIDSDNVVFFDVDDTLVMWKEDSDKHLGSAIHVTDPYDGELIELYPNLNHVKLVKRLHGKGKTIIVWSHGGAKWAKVIVEALGIQDYVHTVMCKVETYVDDIDMNAWPKMNIYIKNNWGG